MEYSPVAELNRTYALYKVHGKQKAIHEAEKLRLSNNRYYHTLRGDLYSGLDDDKAIVYLNAAHSLAKTAIDRAMILKKLMELR